MRALTIEKIILLSTLAKANSILFPPTAGLQQPPTDGMATTNDGLTEILNDLGISTATSATEQSVKIEQEGMDVEPKISVNSDTLTNSSDPLLNGDPATDGMNDVDLLSYLIPELVFDENLAFNLFDELNF